MGVDGYLMDLVTAWGRCGPGLLRKRRRELPREVSMLMVVEVLVVVLTLSFVEVWVMLMTVEVLVVLLLSLVEV